MNLSNPAWLPFQAVVAFPCQVDEEASSLDHPFLAEEACLMDLEASSLAVEAFQSSCLAVEAFQSSC